MKSNNFQLGVGSHKGNDVHLTVIYDSVSTAPDLQTGQGFACVAEVGPTTVLFDTGSDGSILLANMRKLGIDPGQIQIVIISHNRSGHVGGLYDFLAVNQDAVVYVPESFPFSIIENIKKAGAEVIPIISPMELQPNIFTLGEFTSYFKEQAMALRTSKGIVVITGCAHHSILTIMQKAKEIFPEEPIFLALGGFHFGGLGSKDKTNILAGLKNLRLEKIAPSYCCEETCRMLLKKDFGENYVEMGVGGIIIINSIKENKRNIRIRRKKLTEDHYLLMKAIAELA